MNIFQKLSWANYDVKLNRYDPGGRKHILLATWLQVGLDCALLLNFIKRYAEGYGDWKYFWHAFEQLQSDKCILKVSRGIYSLTAKGNQLLQQLEHILAKQEFNTN